MNPLKTLSLNMVTAWLVLTLVADTLMIVGVIAVSHAIGNEKAAGRDVVMWAGYPLVIAVIAHVSVTVWLFCELVPRYYNALDALLKSLRSSVGLGSK